MHKETSPLLTEINLNVRNSSKNENECESQFTGDAATNEEYNSINPETKDSTKTPERATNLAAVMHLFKASVGTGILSLPTAVKDGGTVVGSVGIVIVAIMSVHCMHLLLKCSNYLCKKHQRQHLSYGEVAELASKPYLGDKCIFLKKLVNAFLTVNQLGICSIYMVFVAKTIVEVAAIEISIDTRLIILCLVPITVGFSFVRSLEKIAYISTIANVLSVSGLLMILQYLGRNLKNPEVYPMFAGWNRLAIFFSISIFAFEGITVVLPLYNEVSKPEDFPWVVNFSMTFVTAFYVMIGIFGYIAYGDKISGSVTLNLPDNWLYDTVKCIYAVGTFLSFFIQFYVPMEILLPFLLSKFQKRNLNMLDYMLRALFVVFTCLCAIGIPQIGNFISLIGAVTSSSLSIIFPASIHILVFKKEELSKLALSKNLLLILIGIAAFAIGTYSSLVAIAVGFRSSKNIYL